MKKIQKIAKSVITKIFEAIFFVNSEAARKAREVSFKNSNFEVRSLPHKLADCQSKSPESSELFIVEGDSLYDQETSSRQKKSSSFPIERKNIKY